MSRRRRISGRIERDYLLYRLKASAWSTALQPRERARADAMLQTA